MSTTSSHASTAGAIMIATSWPSAAPVIIGIPRRQYSNEPNSAPHSGEQRNGVTTQEGKIDMMDKDKPNEYPIVVGDVPGWPLAAPPRRDEHATLGDDELEAVD